jgi:hypothetical protein
MPPTNEAFSRVKIDAQLRDQSWVELPRFRGQVSVLVL